ncbi:transketolase [Pseudomonas sp.]|uniref:transketolase n=1 Tax=Pseudomonas sp. TaxID=306 RepID=UPI00272F2962|nr:transketolase [Pseudomonas sp.]MDP2246272.1 transketolase [Pseudomonas sp.]
MTPTEKSALARKAEASAGKTPAASHQSLANAIRALAMDAVQQANSGHPGMPMGTADIATVLFTRFLKIDPRAPEWPDRDRFVLSAGHGSMLLYAVNYLLGYEDMTIEQIRNFRQLGSITAGHPEYGHAAGIETTTGPLGQGIATAVGMALAERLQAARFGDKIVDHYTYVLASDGDLMEGVSHEAIGLAGHLKLSKLIVLYDDNGITIDGALSLSESGDALKRFEAAGWNATRIDGHNPDEIAAAIEKAQKSDRPTLIACRTVIGYGSPNKQGKSSSHGSPLGADEIGLARKELGWSAEPFAIPSETLDAWRIAGLRNVKTRKAWEERLAALDAPTRIDFERRLAGDLPAELGKAISAFKEKLVADKPKWATRKSSEEALNVINAVLPETIGGSADLTGSNNTRSKEQKVVTAEDFSGSFIHYGIREHGMAAAMNGMALHKGLIPYSGTFLVFTDYCRPAIRLSALMGQRVIYVMTHDSIGLGEDGPTHQPIEQLASLRCTPNLDTWRPCDAVESAVAWKYAIERNDGPSALIFSRQNLPHQSRDAQQLADVARGGYVLKDCSGEPELILIATGSEIGLAVAAYDKLSEQGHKVRVVSMPSTSVFDAQDAGYKQQVLPVQVAARIAIEAAHADYWYKYVGLEGRVIGMTTFGESAPAPALFEHFGFTVENLLETAAELLED